MGKLWLRLSSSFTHFFYKQCYFSTQPQCWLAFSWIELQMLLRCYLIHKSILTLKHFSYLPDRPSISDKNYGKNCYLGNFVFLSPSPSYQCWETTSKTCVNLCYGFARLHRRRGGFLNIYFKIPTTFCYWLSEI